MLPNIIMSSKSKSKSKRSALITLVLFYLEVTVFWSHFAWDLIFLGVRFCFLEPCAQPPTVQSSNLRASSHCSIIHLPRNLPLYNHPSSTQPSNVQSSILSATSYCKIIHPQRKLPLYNHPSSAQPYTVLSSILRTTSH